MLTLVTPQLSDSAHLVAAIGLTMVRASSQSGILESRLGAAQTHHSAWGRFRAMGSPSIDKQRFRRDWKRPTTRTVPMNVKDSRSSPSFSWALRPLIVR